MDGVQVTKQEDGTYKLHVPGQTDMVLTQENLGDLIDLLDNLIDKGN